MRDTHWIEKSARAGLLACALLLGGATTPAFAVREPIDEIDASQRLSEDAINVAAWVVASGDNRGQPFAVIDKKQAQLFVFGPDGRLHGLAPILLGSAEGDASPPYTGDHPLPEIPREERTTPAGRYEAFYGPATTGAPVLWVDYGTAVSLHPLWSGEPEQKRKERLTSPEPEDNRITYGCINVSSRFYERVVRPTFKDNGIVYVLPETTALRRAFPEYERPRRRRG